MASDLGVELHIIALEGHATGYSLLPNLKIADLDDGNGALEGTGAGINGNGQGLLQGLADHRRRDKLERLNEYHWLLFSSINAVQYFFNRLYAKGMDARNLKGPQVAAVGQATADFLLQYGIVADLIPTVYTAEGLAQSLLDFGVEGRNILIPRAVKAREFLPETLRGAGAQVTVVPVYRNVPPPTGKEELRAELGSGQVDMISFTSSSTVTNFLAMIDAPNQEELLRLLKGVKIAAIGPVTAKTITDNGLTVDILPTEFTIPSMVAAMVSYYEAGGH